MKSKRKQDTWYDGKLIRSLPFYYTAYVIVTPTRGFSHIVAVIDYLDGSWFVTRRGYMSEFQHKAGMSLELLTTAVLERFAQGATDLELQANFAREDFEHEHKRSITIKDLPRVHSGEIFQKSWEAGKRKKSGARHAET